MIRAKWWLYQCSSQDYFCFPVTQTSPKLLSQFWLRLPVIITDGVERCREVTESRNIVFWRWFFPQALWVLLWFIFSSQERWFWVKTVVHQFCLPFRLHLHSRRSPVEDRVTVSKTWRAVSPSSIKFGSPSSIFVGFVWQNTMETERGIHSTSPRWPAAFSQRRGSSASLMASAGKQQGWVRKWVSRDLQCSAEPWEDLLGAHLFRNTWEVPREDFKKTLPS